MDALLPSRDALAGILSRLPDPVLLVEQGVGLRIAYGNLAAQDLLRSPLADVPLGAVLRQPQVLEAVDRALQDGAEAEVAYASVGLQPRFWRAFVRPVEPGRLVVLLRDETGARRTERMRADFLANASHELRTPLASLAGFIDTLRGHARDDEAARDRFLGIMAAQAGRMRRLIDDLLSLTRIELNEHIAPEGEVDLAALAGDLMDAAAPAARTAQVVFRPRAPGVPVMVRGDRDQLAQVVQNLLDNAIKYSPPGSAVGVQVATAVPRDAAMQGRREGAAYYPLLAPEGSGAAPYAVLRVADAGPGIARQHLPRLSERFYRVEGQKSGERLGTGLGLAIVKHIVNRHRGGLAVESLEGEGTEFSVALPQVS